MSDLAVSSTSRRAGFPAWPSSFRPSRALIGLALPVGAALLWEALVRLGVSDGRLVAPPSRILETLLALWRSGDLGVHLWATGWRVAVGFALGVLVGTGLGALAGASTLARRIIDPTLQGLRSVP